MHASLTPIQSNRIQVLRGLAIASVVMIHNAMPYQEMRILLRPFLNFGVGLFLFLSGFLSSHLTTIPYNRLKKVIIPYLVWTLIYSLYYNFGNFKGIPVDFMRRAAGASGSPAMYYVFVYCELTVLIPLTAKLAQSRYRYLGFLISPIAIVLSRLMPLCLGITLPSFLATIRHKSCLEWFIYFYLGYLMGNQKIRVDFKTSSCICLWGIAIGIEILEACWQASLGNVDPGNQLKLSTTLSGVIYCVLALRFIFSTRQWSWWISPLKTIGDYSFGIFFCHWLIIKLLLHIPGYSNYFDWPEKVLISMSLCIIFVMILGKLPSNFRKYLAC